MWCRWEGSMSVVQVGGEYECDAECGAGGRGV